MPNDVSAIDGTSHEIQIPILDRQQIASQWGLELIFRMHNSDPTPQGVENRNIILWFKCVLTALHINCINTTELISNGDLFQPHLKYTLTFFDTCTSRSRSFIRTLVHSSVYFFTCNQYFACTLATPHHKVWKIEIFFCGLNAY
jgi:hypothetical protein